MKISIEFDDENPIYELLDSTFLNYMKKELENTKYFLECEGYKHPDDIAQWEKNLEALNVLVEYYDTSTRL